MAERTMSDFELRVRGLISVEEYVKRLEARVKEQRREYKARPHISNDVDDTPGGPAVAGQGGK